MEPCDGAPIQSVRASTQHSKDKVTIHHNTYQDKAVNEWWSLLPNAHWLEYKETEIFKEALKPPIILAGFIVENNFCKQILQCNGIGGNYIIVKKGTFHY